MYIWIGCKLPKEFEEEIRQHCLKRNEEIGLDTTAFFLPQHISLKISFDAGSQWQGILDAAEALLRRESPFDVNPSGIETAGSILWITFRENGQLRRLHNVLDKTLKQDFGIPQHLFDKAFVFHSTLFIGEAQRLAQMQAGLNDFVLPEKLAVDTFLLGLSETGRAGEYRVVREIKL